MTTKPSATPSTTTDYKKRINDLQRMCTTVLQKLVEIEENWVPPSQNGPGSNSCPVLSVRPRARVRSNPWQDASQCPSLRSHFQKRIKGVSGIDGVLLTSRKTINHANTVLNQREKPEAVVNGGGRHLSYNNMPAFIYNKRGKGINVLLDTGADLCVFSHCQLWEPLAINLGLRISSSFQLTYIGEMTESTILSVKIIGESSSFLRTFTAVSRSYASRSGSGTSKVVKHFPHHAGISHNSTIPKTSAWQTPNNKERVRRRFARPSQHSWSSPLHMVAK